MFERGHSIPHDDQASRMEAFYGPRELWYPATVHRVIAGDLGDCEGCGDELDPHLRRGVRFHPECSRRPTAGVGSLPERTAGAAPAAPAVLLSQGA